MRPYLPGHRVSDLIAIQHFQSVIPEQACDGTLACRDAASESHNNHVVADLVDPVT